MSLKAAPGYEGIMVTKKYVPLPTCSSENPENSNQSQKSATSHPHSDILMSLGSLGSCCRYPAYIMFLDPYPVRVMRNDPKTLVVLPTGSL